MTEFNVQDAIESLRQELQKDRLASQDFISKKFSELDEKFSDHADDHAELESRVAKVEERQTILGRGLWGVFITVLGTLTTFVLGHR